jgi:lysophospholipase L1-like esterase
MRLLVIGDSHTREMDKFIKSCHPHIEIMLVTKARTTIQVITYFMVTKRTGAISFNPDWIVIHCGHNDVVHHHKFNQNPQFARTVAIQQVQFARNIQAIFPNATILCSSLYPRTSTPTANLNIDETTAYNRMAKRYGLRLRALSAPHNIKCSLNNVLWKKISKMEEAAELYSPDGLHLNKDGKKMVGSEWIQVFTQD